MPARTAKATKPATKKAATKKAAAKKPPAKKQPVKAVKKDVSKQAKPQPQREAAEENFVFTPENFRMPQLPAGLTVRDVKLELATDESLRGLGYLIHGPHTHTVDNGNFEIKPWPVQGWRKLDPGTGDEAGTVEGDFEVEWQGDYYIGKNLAINGKNNHYLSGLAATPEHCKSTGDPESGCIYLWMSDYHPDGAQLFWPRREMPFVCCLGPAAKGDDIKPEDMRAFLVPKGVGLYMHPGTWHNGIYVAPEHLGGKPGRFLTRQGAIHGRISVSWASEFQTLLRVPFRSA